MFDLHANSHEREAPPRRPPCLLDILDAVMAVAVHKVVLLRHGESEWCVVGTSRGVAPPSVTHAARPVLSPPRRNKSNQFTGWTDVDLTELGVQEAIAAGKLLKEEVGGRGEREEGAPRKLRESGRRSASAAAATRLPTMRRRRSRVRR